MSQGRAWPLPIYADGLPYANGHSCTVQVRDLAGNIVVEAVGRAATKKSAQMQAAECAFAEICTKFFAASQHR